MIDLENERKQVNRPSKKNGRTGIVVFIKDFEIPKVFKRILFVLITQIKKKTDPSAVFYNVNRTVNIIEDHHEDVKSKNGWRKCRKTRLIENTP